MPTSRRTRSSSSSRESDVRAERHSGADSSESHGSIGAREGSSVQTSSDSGAGVPEPGVGASVDSGSVQTDSASNSASDVGHSSKAESGSDVGTDNSEGTVSTSSTETSTSGNSSQNTQDPPFDPDVDYKPLTYDGPVTPTRLETSTQELSELRTSLMDAAVRDSAGGAIDSADGVTVTSSENLDKATQLVAGKLEEHMSGAESLFGAHTLSSEGQQVNHELASGFVSQLFDNSTSASNGEVHSALVDRQNTGEALDQVGALIDSSFEAMGSSDPVANQAFLQKMQDFRDANFESTAGGSPVSSMVEQSLANLKEQLPDASAVTQAQAAVVEHSEHGPEASPAQLADTLQAAADRLGSSDGPTGEFVAENLSQMADAVRSENPAMAAVHGAQAQAGLDVLVGDMAQRTNDLAVEMFQQDFSSGLQSVADLAPQHEEGLGSAAAHLTQATLGNVPEGSAIEHLREVMGPAAEQLSDQQLQSAMGSDLAQRVEDLGITAQDVQAAKAELQEAALAQGQDPASVDEAVAVEALVLREDVLEREQAMSSELAPAQEQPDEQMRAERGDEQQQEGTRDAVEDAREHEDVDLEAEAGAEMELTAGQ